MRSATLGQAAVVVGLLITAMISFAAPSDAYALTGKHWQYPGSLTVNISSSYTYIGDGWVNGYIAWNGTPTPVIFSRPGGNQPITLSSANDSSVSWDGTSTWYYNGSITNRATGQINNYYAKNYSSAVVKGIAAHELGHILDLAHSGGCAVMIGNTPARTSCGIYGPAADDINGINYIY